MTAITAAARTHRRSLIVVATIAVIALALVGLILFMVSPSHDMHQVVNTYHHMPHFLQALLGAQHLGA
jgi:hypothetical protein